MGDEVLILPLRLPCRHRAYREEVLDQYLFARLEDVREATWQFLIDYHEHRHHNALGGMTPAEYRNARTSTPKCLLDGGAYGWKPKPVWAMNQQSLSPAYTSKWSDLLRVH